LSRIAASPRPGAAERAAALNVLGQIAEADGKPRAAFRHFTRAKSAAPGRYSPAAFDRFLAEQRQRYQPNLAAASDDGPRVVFITGMPRSGTTLAEQILARHPDVLAIGESQALPKAQQACRAALPGAQSGSAWHWAGRLGDNQKPETSVRSQPD